MTSCGRIFCVFFPYAVTVGALVALIFVGIGSTNSSSTTDNDLYFVRLDLSNLTTSTSSSLLSSAESALSGVLGRSSTGSASALASALAASSNLRDFYDIGLWGYCSGNKTSSGKFDVDYCSKPKSEFAFDPISVWGLNTTSSENTVLEDVFPEGLRGALDTYDKVSKWMFIAYVVAFIATALELVIGLTAICSRLGSLVTSIISGVAFFFTAAASITSTAMFAVLIGVFNTDLDKYGMHATMGKNIYVATWIATAFAFAGPTFWLLSACCCSARSPYHGDRRRNRVMAEKAPYTYERVNEPYANNTAYGAGAPAPYAQHHQQSAYEPFRSV